MLQAATVDKKRGWGKIGSSGTVTFTMVLGVEIAGHNYDRHKYGEGNTIEVRDELRRLGT